MDIVSSRLRLAFERPRCHPQKELGLGIYTCSYLGLLGLGICSRDIIDLAPLLYNMNSDIWNIMGYRCAASFLLRPRVYEIGKPGETRWDDGAVVGWQDGFYNCRIHATTKHHYVLLGERCSHTVHTRRVSEKNHNLIFLSWLLKIG